MGPSRPQTASAVAVKHDVLICYLVDVDALFDGDGTRCAVPQRARYAAGTAASNTAITDVERSCRGPTPEM